MHTRVDITGLGLVSSLGCGVTDTWDALLAGRYITTHSRAGLELNRVDRINILATSAADEAMRDARWSDRAAPGRTALVVATSKGMIENWITPPPATSDKLIARRGDLIPPGLARLDTLLRARFSTLDGPAITLSSACASGLCALIRAAMMIRSEEADRVLVVAAEASVHPLFLASFKRLGVLPKEGIGCRPFDQSRDGFLMSEAAAAVCLEPAIEPHLSRVYAAVDRFALAGDATHMTGADPSGRTLRRLLQSVVNQRKLDLVHAHGTGTVLHDPIELSAIDDSIAGDSPPAVYSHKGALGHSLGAAGLVSVVLNGMMHRHGIVPANVRTIDALPAEHLIVNREIVRRPIHRSLAIASGFGGSTAVVSLISP